MPQGAGYGGGPAAGKGGRNDSKGGTAAAGAAQGHLGAGYGGNAGPKAGGAPAKGMSNAGQVNGGPLNEQIAQTFAAYKNALTNFNDDSFGTTLGRFGASLLGFNKIDPQTQGHGNFDPRQNSSAGQSVLGGGPQAAHADWGFDPAGLLGSAFGMAAGVPFGTGLIANQISKWAGRPMEMNMGQSVFGGIGGQSNTNGIGMGAGAGNSFGGLNPGMAASNGLASVQAPAPSAPGASPTASVGGNYQGMLGQPAYQWNSRFGQGLLGKY